MLQSKVTAKENTSLQAEFLRNLEQSLPQDEPQNANDGWNSLRDVIYDSALDSLGKKSHKSCDWFEANIEVMEPLIRVKRLALSKYKESASQSNLTRLRNARSKAQTKARQCANSYWLKLSDEIQQSSDSGNIGSMYEGIKRATGPAIKKTAPLKSKTGTTLTDPKRQMERWVEHYCELYSTQREVTQEALDAIPNKPVMTELDADPTLEDVSKAIDALSCGKAPGNDGISPEIIKHGKDKLLVPLYQLLLQCWKEKAVPQEMRDVKIITLFKKGDRSDCNNYRGISLLSIVGKLYGRVVLSRLQKLAERVYPDSQCGFRAGRSTVDMIFSLRQLQEKCREQRKPLFIAFVDLTKAFDLVSRKGLFQLLEKIGCPPTLLSIIKSFHDDMKALMENRLSHSKSRVE